MKIKLIVSLCTSVAAIVIVAISINIGSGIGGPKIISGVQGINNKIDTSVINTINNIYGPHEEQKTSLGKEKTPTLKNSAKKIEKKAIENNKVPLDLQGDKIEKVQKIDNSQLVTAPIILEKKTEDIKTPLVSEEKVIKGTSNKLNEDKVKSNVVKGNIEPLAIVKNLPNSKVALEKPKNDLASFQIKNNEFNVSEPFVFDFNKEGKLVKTENKNYKEFSYKDLGATAKIGEENVSIKFQGNVNNSIPGTYPVKLEAKAKDGKVTSMIIDVKIKDVKPILKIKNVEILGSKIKYSDFILGACSIEGENLTNKILINGHEFKKNDYLNLKNGEMLHISVKDKYGLQTEINIKVKITEI